MDEWYLYYFFHFPYTLLFKARYRFLHLDPFHFNLFHVKRHLFDHLNLFNNLLSLNLDDNFLNNLRNSYHSLNNSLYRHNLLHINNNLNRLLLDIILNSLTLYVLFDFNGFLNNSLYLYNFRNLMHDRNNLLYYFFDFHYSLDYRLDRHYFLLY
jgi:hypothetical protein